MDKLSNIPTSDQGDDDTIIQIFSSIEGPWAFVFYQVCTQPASFCKMLSMSFFTLYL